jgi:hypothetical protein
VTRCEQVPETQIENYTTRVAVPAIKEMEVQVCRMVPKVVSMTICPCPGSAPSSMPASGKGAPQQAPPPAPTQAPSKTVSVQTGAPVSCCGG